LSVSQPPSTGPSIGALQVVLDKGQEEDWFSSRWIVGLTVVTVAALVAFVIRELRTDDPVVNLRVFRERTYAAGTSLMTLLGFVLYGSMVALPIFLQTLLGYPSAQAGITMAPRGLGSFLGMPLVGVVIGRVDPRKMLGVGLVGAALSLMALSRLSLDAGFWNLFWPQFFQGFFMAMLFVPLTTITMDAIRPEEMGNATSLFNLMRNIGGSVGIAVATTMIARSSQTFLNTLGGHVNPYNPPAQAMIDQLRAYFISKGADPATAAREAYAAVYGMVQQQAALLSYLNEFKFFGIVFLVMLPLIFVMKRPARGRGPVAMH
jgi:DHA2 family multidrug resistance protein